IRRRVAVDEQRAAALCELSNAAAVHLASGNYCAQMRTLTSILSSLPFGMKMQQMQSSQNLLSRRWCAACTKARRLKSEN
ncbi:uncharacterized, partial [Tachysurus ichikawai]